MTDREIGSNGWAVMQYPETFSVFGSIVEVHFLELADALHTLPNLEREIILAYYLLGYRDVLIAAQLRMKRRTVQYHRQRALNLLRDVMRREDA